MLLPLSDHQPHISISKHSHRQFRFTLEPVPTSAFPFNGRSTTTTVKAMFCISSFSLKVIAILAWILPRNLS